MKESIGDYILQCAELACNTSILAVVSARLQMAHIIHKLRVLLLLLGGGGWMVRCVVVAVVQVLISSNARGDDSGDVEGKNSGDPSEQCVCVRVCVCACACMYDSCCYRMRPMCSDEAPDRFGPA